MMEEIYMYIPTRQSIDENFQTGEGKEDNPI